METVFMRCAECRRFDACSGGTPAARTNRRSPLRNRILSASTGVFLMFTLVFPTMAQTPPPESHPAANEWGLLPPYCPDTNEFGKYGQNSPNAPKWVALMGQTFWHLHHYCFGILKFERAQRQEYPPVIREGLLTSALGEFAYVIREMPQNYVLAPEIYTYVGRTYLLKDDLAHAESAFAKAQTDKPDYWPAYSWLALWLEHHGQQNKAREVVANGLKHAPDSRTLLLIKQRLGS